MCYYIPRDYTNQWQYFCGITSYGLRLFYLSKLPLQDKHPCFIIFQIWICQAKHMVYPCRPQCDIRFNTQPPFHLTLQHCVVYVSLKVMAKLACSKDTSVIQSLHMYALPQNINPAVKCTDEEFKTNSNPYTYVACQCKVGSEIFNPSTS